MVRKFDPRTIYPPLGQYWNAVEVGPGERLVFSSGIIGMTAEGVLVEDPEAQIAQAWANVAAWLEGVGLGPEHLVRLTMRLVDRDLLPASKAGRIAALGVPMHCAVTGVMVGLFDPALVLEIDVCAAA